MKTKEVAESVMKGVDFVFEQNQNLSRIGTEIQYSNYVRSIFPESLVKEIVYHGSPKNNIEKFVSPEEEDYAQNKGTTTGNAGIYFSDNLNEAAKYSKWGNAKDGKVYPVVLNIKKRILIQEIPNIDGWSKSHMYHIQPGFIKPLKDAGVDAFVSGKYMIATEGFKEIAVISNDKSNIHILGNSKDESLFQKFIENSKKDKLLDGMIGVSGEVKNIVDEKEI